MGAPYRDSFVSFSPGTRGHTRIRPIATKALLDAETGRTAGELYYCEADRHIYAWDDDGSAWVDQGESQFQQIVTVAKSGGDYTSIQTAIDSITDESATKVYCVLVYPGTYTENLDIPPNIHVIGTQRDACHLEGETSGAIHIVNRAGGVSGLANFRIDGYELEAGGGGRDYTRIQLSGPCYLSNLDIDVAPHGASGDRIAIECNFPGNVTSQQIHIDNCIIDVEASEAAPPSAGGQIGCGILVSQGQPRITNNQIYCHGTATVTRAIDINTGSPYIVGNLLNNINGTPAIAIANFDFNNDAVLGPDFYEMKEQASVDTATSGYGRLYFKDDNLPYAMNDAGTEYCLADTLEFQVTVGESDAIEAVDTLFVWTNNEDAAVTIVEIDAISDISSAQFALAEYAHDGTTASPIDTITTATGSSPYTANIVTGFDDASIADGARIAFDYIAGTPSHIHFYVRYTR